MVAGGTDDDDVLDDPVPKKPNSSSKQNAGKRSRKVMTEVNIARYQFSLSIFLVFFLASLVHVVAPIVRYSAQMPIRKFNLLIRRHISMLVN